MREIKFRVRGKDSNKYLNEGKGLTLKEIQNICEIEACDFEQFTGLKDKKGKEIYEGDIICLCKNKGGFLKVEFKNQYVGGWVLTYKNEKDLSLGARDCEDLEISGNIHENPELLEVK